MSTDHLERARPGGLPEALFLPGEDPTTFVPTDLTRGGWSAEAQHGGPPCGLLAHAIERHPSPVEMTTVRLTVDLVRPVPLEPLRVEVETVRPGKRVELVSARLLHGTTEVSRALALRIRRAAVPLPDVPPGEPFDLPDPDALPRIDLSPWRPGDLPCFHADAAEIRARPDDFTGEPPRRAWVRLRYPVVAGIDPSPFVALATVADMANGMTRMLPSDRYLYVNPDLTLYVHRIPEGRWPDGPWVGMRGRSYPSPAGHGVADTEVLDRQGPCGRILQSQLVDRWDPSTR